MKKISILCVVLAGIAWGTAGVFVDYLTRFGFSSVQIAFARCLVSAMLGIIIAAITNPKSLKLSFKQFIFCALSGIAFYSMAVFYYSAMKAASVPTASVMLNMAPILVIIFAVLFFEEKMNLKKIIAILVAVAGCAFVTGVADGMLITPTGLLYGFLAMLSYAIYSICVKFAMFYGVKPAGATAYCFLFGAITALFVTNPVSFASQITMCPWYVVAALVAMAALTGFIATFLYSNAMKGLPAGLVSAMASIEPLTSTTLSILILHQSLTLWAAIGIVMILSAVTMLGRE